MVFDCENLRDDECVMIVCGNNFLLFFLIWNLVPVAVMNILVTKWGKRDDNWVIKRMKNERNYAQEIDENKRNSLKNFSLVFVCINQLLNEPFLSSPLFLKMKIL